MIRTWYKNILPRDPKGGKKKQATQPQHLAKLKYQLVSNQINPPVPFSVSRTAFRFRFSREACTATEMISTIEMISAIEMTPNHHRNDPHHRNDTGGHHRNDPRNIGNGIKRTTKTGQQFRACFLFIYIASFLRCVIYLFTALYFAVNCLFFFLV